MRYVVIAMFLLIVASLFSAAVFMFRDRSGSKRMSAGRRAGIFGSIAAADRRRRRHGTANFRLHRHQEY